MNFQIFGQPERGEKRSFSRAVKAGGLVFVSGHSAPHDPAKGIHRGETPQEQVRNSLAFIAKILTDAGSDFSRIVQVTMLITDRKDYDACNEEYVKHFPGGLPARHTVLFGVPTEAKVGFACIALADEEPPMSGRADGPQH
ncbi:MAG: RidA family protein [Alphaproteobacteria bacterium]|nr:RidA family protein [Alphaproteobacteria bacterium]